LTKDTTVRLLRIADDVEDTGDALPGEKGGGRWVGEAGRTARCGVCTLSWRGADCATCGRRAGAGLALLGRGGRRLCGGSALFALEESMGETRSRMLGRRVMFERKVLPTDPLDL